MTTQITLNTEPTKPISCIKALAIPLILHSEYLFWGRESDFINGGYIEKCIGSGYLPVWVAKDPIFKENGIEFKEGIFLVKGKKPIVCFSNSGDEMRRLHHFISTKTTKEERGDLCEGGSFWWEHELCCVKDFYKSDVTFIRNKDGFDIVKDTRVLKTFETFFE